jgi:hypothetical protein
MTTPTQAKKREAAILAVASKIADLVTGNIGTSSEHWQYEERQQMSKLLAQLSKEWRRDIEY